MKRAIKIYTGISLIIVLGFLVTHTYIDKDQSKTSGSTNKPPQSAQKPVSSGTKAHIFSMQNGKIILNNDGTWKATNGGYYDASKGKCGLMPGFDPSCLEAMTLILSQETFTNPDQFCVEIVAVDKGGSTFEAWLNARGKETGDDPTQVIDSEIIINGLRALRREVSYTWYGPEYQTHETRVKYIIDFTDINTIIVIRSTFFDAIHNSYKSSTNYYPYKVAVDKLVYSIQRR